MSTAEVWRGGWLASAVRLVRAAERPGWCRPLDDLPVRVVIER
jgi:hypothetical protein